jgi:hypothetical protein
MITPPRRGGGLLLGLQERLELLPADVLVRIGAPVGDLDPLLMQAALALLGATPLVVAPELLDEATGTGRGAGVRTPGSSPQPVRR